MSSLLLRTSFFVRGRRQGRQPLNPAMPRRVVVAAKHSFSYPGARPCRRPSPKILQPAGVFTFLGVRGGKKEVKFEDAFWRFLLGVFWSIFGKFFIIFWYCPRVKIVNLHCFCAFGIQKKLLTTCRKLRKYQCFC